MTVACALQAASLLCELSCECVSKKATMLLGVQLRALPSQGSQICQLLLQLEVGPPPSSFFALIRWSRCLIDCRCRAGARGAVTVGVEGERRR